jgi:plasmid stability protein
MQYGSIMSTITKKDVPASLHRVLKCRAKTHGRSLNKEIIAALENTAHSAPLDATAIRQHAVAVRESMGVYLTQKDLTAFKLAGRR